MNTSSAFARVIGITRSLSPLSFDRGHDKDEEQVPDVAKQPVELDADAAVASPGPAPAWLNQKAVLEPDAVPAPPVAPEANTPDTLVLIDQNDPFGFSGPPTEAGVVVQFPALAQITVVADAPGGPVAAQTSDALEASPGRDLIDAIQTDVAALLASEQAEEAEGLTGDEGLAEASSVEEEQDEQPEEPTLALLSELNRMWGADPNVSGNRWP